MPDVTGLTGMRQLLEMSRSTIGDMRGTIEDLVARAIKSRAVGLVASLTEARYGPAATGKAITVTGIAIYRIVNGKIQEEWDYRDVLGLMRQLGVSPQQDKG
jgi:predicted ester cyclase